MRVTGGRQVCLMMMAGVRHAEELGALERQGRTVEARVGALNGMSLSVDYVYILQGQLPLRINFSGFKTAYVASIWVRNINYSVKIDYKV